MYRQELSLNINVQAKIKKNINLLFIPENTNYCISSYLRVGVILSSFDF